MIPCFFISARIALILFFKSVPVSVDKSAIKAICFTPPSVVLFAAGRVYVAPGSPFAPFKFLKAKLNTFAVFAPLAVTVTDGTPVFASTVAVGVPNPAAAPGAPTCSFYTLLQLVHLSAVITSPSLHVVGVYAITHTSYFALPTFAFPIFPLPTKARSSGGAIPPPTL
mgnify:CR=1 FL=1